MLLKNFMGSLIKEDKTPTTAKPTINITIIEPLLRPTFLTPFHLFNFVLLDFLRFLSVVQADHFPVLFETNEEQHLLAHYPVLL